MGQKITGPNTPSPHELADVVALANRVFRTARDGDMGSEYPLLFGTDRLGQLRIFQVDGRAVAMVGMILNDAVLLGCDVRVACVGSVCTDRAHRGSGLAGRLMDDAVERACAAGASIMLISGDRTLYARRGAFAEGRFHQYKLHPAALGRPGPDVQVKQIDPPSCADALRMSQAEPIHFRRTRAEYAAQIASSFTQDRPGATYEARREPTGCGADTAVLSVSCPGPPVDDERIVRVVELAGDRSLVLPATCLIADELGADAVEIDAYVTDAALGDACAAIGVGSKLVGFHGTVKLLDVGRLWRDFAPLLCERIGGETYRRIAVRSEADDLKINTLSFELDGESVAVEGAREILAALFGSPRLDPLGVAAHGRAADVLRRALPLPLPLYGMNYV